MVLKNEEIDMVFRSAVKIFCVGLLLLAMAGTAFAASATPPANGVDAVTGATFKNGKVTAVPTMSVNDLQKKLQTYQGKVVVLNIFASWCPPCRKEIPVLKELAQNFSDDVVVVGISIDKSAQALFTFMDQNKFTYPVFLGIDGLEKTMGISAIPQMFMFNRSGQLYERWEGLQPKEALFKKVEDLVKKK